MHVLLSHHESKRAIVVVDQDIKKETCYFTMLQSMYKRFDGYIVGSSSAMQHDCLFLCVDGDDDDP